MTDSPEKLAGALDEPELAAPAPADAKAEPGPRTFTLWQRARIVVAGWAGYLAVLLVGRTLRWEVYGWENWEAAHKLGKRLIYTLWHREIFAATWFWRQRGIVAMVSQNFDGEYIARIFEWHGYGAARGSSSRGASRALVEMVRAMRAGRDAALTLDGPRGPRFVAKRGSVILAKASGGAILCFHIAVKKAYVFRKSWDQTQIPHPFSPAAVFIAPPILVSEDADDAEQERKLAEVQRTLDDLRSRGEKWLTDEEDQKSKRETGN